MVGGIFCTDLLCEFATTLAELEAPNLKRVNEGFQDLGRIRSKKKNYRSREELSNRPRIRIF